MSERPPLSELLADPASMVLRTDLLRAGWPERAVDALFQRAGKRLSGFSRPYVLASDVAAAVSPIGDPVPIGSERAAAAVSSSTAAATLPRVCQVAHSSSPVVKGHDGGSSFATSSEAARRKPSTRDPSSASRTRFCAETS